ncbi:MAG: hypothetical protein EOS78_09850 [Mesorhizobium sp.]|uniref:contact-dependent growth inhibition system immunity protein n=1 Tax=unclassified Mesorhizobium TaxID=325217 RepID=UPI000F7522FF|nr:MULTISPECIES: contact-dependent growth inhibition system immunity protein [unclassified Mesorhizobium]AZO53970.1 hypothetical protein EJ077_11125 [Mesorhizobium sp. M8A.F.Ca.ET.057.01.1.1]RWE39856.1 MAG: hypothetical protein EOS78_09850 [Mesorhizobium sp.]RWE41997.1 MAG: hypothetical protein EOS80_26860 [Mesorhizobium sp.]
MKPRGNVDEDRKLRVLVGWPHARSSYPSSLVERCEAALDTPLGQLSTEQLRLLIGQEIGLEILVVKAIDLIEMDPLVHGDYYDGDLISMCLKISGAFWATHPDLWFRLNEVLESFDRKVEAVNEHRAQFMAANPYGAR